MGILRWPRHQLVEPSAQLETIDDLMAAVDANSLSTIAAALEMLTGVEERIDLTLTEGRLRCELGGETFEILFPTSVSELVQQISNSEDACYDTVSPRGYEDFDLFDEW